MGPLALLTCDPRDTKKVPYVGSDLARSRKSASAAGVDDLSRDDHGRLPTAWDQGPGVSGRAPPSGQCSQLRKTSQICIQSEIRKRRTVLSCRAAQTARFLF